MQNQVHGVDEQETTVINTNPVNADIRSEWHWVKPGIEEVLREHPQLTFIPEDIYTACVTQMAGLWVAPEGFVITTSEEDQFNGKKTCLLWVAWTRERGQNCAMKYQDFFIELARNAGYNYIETRTPIAAMEKYFLGSGWGKDTVIYTREL